MNTIGVRMSLFLFPVSIMACCAHPSMRDSAAVTPAAYPSGDDAAVYRAVLDSLLSGFRASLVVLHDKTTERNLSAWEERRARFGLDPSMVVDAVGKTSARLPVSSQFGYRLPVVLISDSAQAAISSRGMEIERATPRLGPAEGFWMTFHSKYPGSAGIVSLSRVGFNKGRTQAIVDFEFACGSVCGYYGIDVLENTGTGWRVTRHLVEAMS